MHFSSRYFDITTGYWKWRLQETVLMFLSRLSFETVELKQDKNSDEESSSDDDDSSSSDDENEVKIELDVSCTIWYYLTFCFFLFT